MIMFIFPSKNYGNPRENITDRHHAEVNVVLDSKQPMTQNANFSKNIWLFIFQNSNETSELSNIKNHFINLKTLTLDSQLYGASVDEKTIKIYEIYQKQFGMNLVANEVKTFQTYKISTKVRLDSSCSS